MKKLVVLLLALLVATSFVACGSREPTQTEETTVALEIGHAVLKHQDEDDPAAEREANCFARNLLCPLPVALALDVRNEDDYVSAFNVSIQMARATVGRRSSDAYYIKKDYSSVICDKLYAYNMGFESFTAFEQHVYA